MPGSALIDRGVAEERRVLRHRGELRGELAEGEVLGPLAHEAERRDVPERRRAAVAEDDLVALGQAEQVGQALPDRADEVPDRGLAVRGAEQRGAQAGEVVDLLGSHLGGPGAEPAVLGQQVGGDRGRRSLGHPASLSPRPEAWDVRSTTRT